MRSGATSVVLFDVDGTLLDSAPGIVDGFRYAVGAVGLPVPDEATVRADIGPAAPLILASLGVPAELVPAAFVAYRERYREVGLDLATVYPGVVSLLGELQGRVRLATATAKMTTTAELFLARHGLDAHFEVIGGSWDGGQRKHEVIAATLNRLGSPDPESVIMVGDRGSDLTGAAACGVRSVGVSWGYGSRAELAAADPDHVINDPAELLTLL